LNCQNTEKLVHAFADEELDLVKGLEVEDHLKECSACAERHQSIQTLRSRIREQSTHYELPARLPTRVRTATGAKELNVRRPSVHWGWMAIAASLLVAAIAIPISVHFLPPRPVVSASLSDELFASHVRSQMLASHLVDVESSDQHTVKPWFRGKLDFSPSVIDLKDQGFTLVGGRVDYVGRRPVAVLVYQRRKHVINLFIWPSQESQGTPSVLTQQGFHLISWTHAGTAYCAVSDLNEDELKEFAGLIQTGR
jgi:anti-sigma factor RsiW